MEYLDPIETARAILAGELSANSDLEEDLDTELELIEAEDIEEEIEDVEEAMHGGKKKMNASYGSMNASKKKKDDEDDEDEDDDDEQNEGIIDPKSEEDPDLYKDAEGKGAKVAKPTGNASGKNKASIKSKPSAAKGKVETPTATKEEIDHHMSTLFDGEELSEEFKTKASTIFEAVIAEKISEVENSLLEQYEEVIESHTNAISKELAEKLDNYLSYVVEKWVDDNELAIETGIRADIAEDFMTGLKELFENSYVSVPEEKDDLVEQLAETVVDLSDKLEEEIARNLDLRSNVMESRCDSVLNEVCEGLVDTEAEKLRSLAEGIEYDTEDQYREKLDILKESYFNSTTTGLLEEDSNSNPVIEATPEMESYVSALSRSAKVQKNNTIK